MTLKPLKVQLFYSPYCSNTIVSDQPLLHFFTRDKKTTSWDLFSDWPLDSSNPLIAWVFFCYACVCVVCVRVFVFVCVCVVCVCVCVCVVCVCVCVLYVYVGVCVCCMCVCVCTVSLYNILLILVMIIICGIRSRGVWNNHRNATRSASERRVVAL